MAATIESLFNNIQANIEDVKADAADALDRLDSFANMPFQTWVGFAPNTIFEPPKYTASKDIQDITNIDLPTFDESKLSLDNAERYRTKLWDDPELEYVVQQLRVYLETAGLGHSEEYIRSFSEYQKERDREAFEDAAKEIRSVEARKGFPLPTSMLLSQIESLGTKYQYAIYDRNRELLQRFSEIVDKNIQFALEKEIDISKLYSDFSLRFSDIFRDVSTLVLEQYKTILQAKISEFEATIKGITAEIELARANADVELGYNQITIEKWKTEVTSAVEKTKALISQAENATQVRLAAARELASTLVGIIASSQQHSVGLVSTQEQLNA